MQTKSVIYSYDTILKIQDNFRSDMSESGDIPIYSNTYFEFAIINKNELYGLEKDINLVTV